MQRHLVHRVTLSEPSTFCGMVADSWDL